MGESHSDERSAMDGRPGPECKAGNASQSGTPWTFKRSRVSGTAANARTFMCGLDLWSKQGLRRPQAQLGRRKWRVSCLLRNPHFPRPCGSHNAGAKICPAPCARSPRVLTVCFTSVSTSLVPGLSKGSTRTPGYIRHGFRLQGLRPRQPAGSARRFSASRLLCSNHFIAADAACPQDGQPV